MGKRKPLSKKIRFEVFKRDSFTCQYCGRKPPEVELEVDHIRPVAKGGKNEILNLVTSCKECNRGKRDVELSDQSVVEKQRKQLETLQAKNEQLEMMLKWRDELSKIDEKEINLINDIFDSRTGYGFNDIGKKTIKSLIKKFGIEEVIECTEISIDTYYRNEEDWEITFKKVSAIANTRKRQREDNTLLYKNRLCKYAQKKFDYFNRYKFMEMLNKFVFTERDQDQVFDVLKSVGNWSELIDRIEELIEIAEDYENYKKWCEENGNKESS